LKKFFAGELLTGHIPLSDLATNLFYFFFGAGGNAATANFQFLASPRNWRKKEPHMSFSPFQFFAHTLSA